MAALQQPAFSLIYEGKDITEDISRYATNISYTDATGGESDEIQITLEDTDGNWKSSWKPTKGDKIILKMGYQNALVDCGIFEVDELTISGPPDTVSFRALATPITSPFRAQNSKAFENQNLANLVQFFASKYGLTVQGNIPNLTIPRATQANESDLAFLNRIAKEFSMLFSIRGTILVFTSVIELEDSEAALEIAKTDCLRYEFTDKSVEVANAVETAGVFPRTGELVSSRSAYLAIRASSYKAAAWSIFENKIKIGMLRVGLIQSTTLPSALKNLYDYVNRAIEIGYSNIDLDYPLEGHAKGFVKFLVAEDSVYYKAAIKYISKDYAGIANAALGELLTALQGNVLEDADSRAYVEQYQDKYVPQTKQIAEYRAEAESYVRRTRQITGRLTIIGQPIALAGSNFNLTGFGNYDGVYHIEKSTHTLTRSSGYTTDIDIKLIKQ